jgi:DNA-binding MltR family transcriptional regulator
MAETAATIAFFMQLRAQLISDIEEIESGDVEIIRVAGRINANQDRLVELRHRLANLDQVIAFFQHARG